MGKIFQDLREGKDSTSIDNDAEKIIQIQEEGEPDSDKTDLKFFNRCITKFISRWI